MFGLSFGDDTSRNVTGFESSDRVPIVGDRIIIIIGGDNSMTAGYWWGRVTSVHDKYTPLNNNTYRYF